MTEHDPLCPVNTMAPNEGGCYCSLVRKVRADEREHINNLMYAIAEQKTLDDLRAKVEALRVANSGTAKSGNRLDQDFNLGKVYAYERVLALIDGSSE
jgi:hypothetical protein